MNARTLFQVEIFYNAEVGTINTNDGEINIKGISCFFCWAVLGLYLWLLIVMMCYIDKLVI